MERNACFNYNTLPMENAFNVRELGGYAARKGSITKYHEFLRSDSLTDITAEDQEFLIKYGLKAVIDLRGREETLIYPNPFRENPQVAYINLPFITETVLDMRAVREEGFRPEVFYVNLVEYKEMVKELFQFILAHAEGCILFHCQAGKDRTGILAMLLLGICGVSREDIIANYQVTHTYLKNHVELRIEDGLEELEYSKPEWIEAAYDHIMNDYGSFRKYLLSAGLSKKDIKAIRRKLIQKAL
ncbi:MAG: tyrosine-protein phosphatase [Clostridiales bacterium]|nr:tyrosine-protein phosphatase [Clostridiales bacterium]